MTTAGLLMPHKHTGPAVKVRYIILQVNINGLRNKLEELKLLIHDTHADIITVQETKLTPKAKTPKIHNFTSVRTDGLHGAGGGLITLVGDNITFTTTDIPSTINTHNIELQMVRVHINNTEHITISNIYIPPDDHRGQLMADVISNSDHMTLNTNTPARVPGTTLQRTSSADITTVSDALCGRTSWTTQHALLSDHLPIIATVNVRHDCRLRQSRRTVANCRKADWTQFAEYTGSAFAQTAVPTGMHTADRVFTGIILMADGRNIPGSRMHGGCGLLPEDMVCRVTQRGNMGRVNTCDPALKLLDEEITSDIQKHKQNIWKEHLDAHWDHRHNTHTLWGTVRGLSGRAPPHTLNTSMAFDGKMATTPTHLANCFTGQFAGTVKHAKQADTLTERHTTYGDTTLHSLLLRSKRL